MIRPRVIQLSRFAPRHTGKAKTYHKLSLKRLLVIYYSYVLLLLPLVIPTKGIVYADGPKAPEPIKDAITLVVNVPVEQVALETVYIPPKTLKPVRGAYNASGNTYTPGNCTWAVKNWRPDIPNSWGNANTWFSRAQAMGWPTGYTPKVGAIGTKGNHVVYITGISGNDVTYRDMNGRYILYEIGYRTVPASTLKYIY